MKEETLSNIAYVLSLAVAVAVAVAAVAAVAAVVAAVAAVVAAVAAVVAAVLVVGYNPKLSIRISCTIISLCIGILIYALPIALTPIQVVQVVCQQTSTQTQIFIHQSTTETITKAISSNVTTTQIISKVTCP